MNKQARRQLRSGAADTLKAASYCPHRLVLIHTAVSSGLTLLIAVVSFLLNQKIAGTSGLGGIGTRSMLETVQSLLSMLNLILIPFWSMGLTWAFMLIGRREDARPGTLLEGFRHFGPVLRAKLLQTFVLMGAALLGSYVGMFLYTMTPMATSLYEAMLPYMEGEVIDYAAMLEESSALRTSLLYAMPFMVGCMAILTVPLYYRLRLMDYVLMDHPEKGAMYAMRATKAIMRGKRRSLFRLDLGFWWFYLLEALVMVLCYGDVLLALAGIDLGMSETVAYFIFYILALLAQLGLYVWKRPLLLATYAGFYDSVRPRSQDAMYPPVGEI